MKNVILATTVLLVFLQASTSVFAQNEENDAWPLEIRVPQGIVVVYQPQPEKLEGDRLDARAAVSVEEKGTGTPVFGAIWFTARLETDRDERTATIADISVTRTRFAERDEAKANQLKKLLKAEMPKWDLSISMDQLLATLETRELQMAVVSQINTDPPVILFLPEPAVLITIDGEPRLKKEKGSDLMRVINTPFTLLLDPKDKTYYLNADAKTWYTATDIKGAWKVAASVPKEIAALAPEPEPADEEEAEEKNNEPGPPPRIVLATEPTELISSTGEPEYTPISGTELLYMTNTDTDLLLHLTNQQHYVLLAGRWYAANSLDGPWRYVAGKELPKDFAKIPEDSQMGTVLYAVPGTTPAEEAVLDAQIPQTAAIERRNAEARLNVEYDGDAEFEKIEGTTMAYAVNTPTPVIHAGTRYYAVEDAVWFMSRNATGPWVVAISVPDVIYTIPATSPVYYVTYVRIYDYTDDVIYVGYLPGYTGTYVYHSTIIYGTGYYYPGWYRIRYYPRYSTWGFHVRYNPWRGWNFGLSYSSGPFTFYLGRGGWYRGGWWGPGRYRGYGRGYRHGRRAGYRAGYRAGQRSATRQNMYKSQRNQARVAPQNMARTQARATAASGRANNVYADKDGNVHRRTDKGWEQRKDDGWKSDRQRPESQPSQRPESQPSSKPGSNAGSKQHNKQLDNSYKARKRGSQRASNFNKSRGRARGGRRR